MKHIQVEFNKISKLLRTSGDLGDDIDRLPGDIRVLIHDYREMEDWSKEIWTALTKLRSKMDKGAKAKDLDKMYKDVQAIADRANKEWKFIYKYVKIVYDKAHSENWGQWGQK